MTGERAEPPRPGPAAFTAPVAPGNGGAGVLARVVEALARSDDAKAAAEIASVAGQTLDSHPLERLDERSGGRSSAGNGRRTLSPSLRVVASVYVRDSFICTYCARRTVPLAVMRLVSLRFPEAFPHHPNWKRSVAHRLYWDISATIDHVEAVSTGGDWRSEENWPPRARAVSTRRATGASKVSGGPAAEAQATPGRGSCPTCGRSGSAWGARRAAMSSGATHSTRSS